MYVVCEDQALAFICCVGPFPQLLRTQARTLTLSTYVSRPLKKKPFSFVFYFLFRHMSLCWITISEWVASFEKLLDLISLCLGKDRGVFSLKEIITRSENTKAFLIFAIIVSKIDSLSSWWQCFWVPFMPSRMNVNAFSSELFSKRLCAKYNTIYSCVPFWEKKHCNIELPKWFNSSSTYLMHYKSLSSFFCKAYLVHQCALFWCIPLILMQSN